MSPQPIDLSAGIVKNQSSQPAPPPSETGGIDLSAGLASAAPTSQQPDYLSKTEDFIHEGAKGAGEELVGAAKGMATIPGASAFADIPLEYQAYEKARQSGKGIMDSMKAASDAMKQKHDAITALQDRVKEFSTNPGRATGKAIVDLMPLIIGGVSGLTGDAEAAGAVENANVGMAGEPTEAAEAGTTPVEEAVEKHVGKAGLKNEGQAAITEGPKVEDVSPETQQALRDHVNEITKQEGFKTVSSNTPIREIYNKLGDQFYARSKAMFDKIQEATGVDINHIQRELYDLRLKLSQEAGDDPARVGNLVEKINDKTDIVNQAIEQAKKTIDPDTGEPLAVEQAKIDWKKYNAAYDQNAHVVGSTTGRTGIGKGEITDPNKLATRLERASVPDAPNQQGRLQQIGGDTESLLDKIEKNRSTVKDFEPTTSTGKQAFRELIKAHTGEKATALRGTKPTFDAEGALKEFGQMDTNTRAATYGNDVKNIEQYLQQQAVNQYRMKLLKWGSGVVGLGGLEETVRRTVF